MSFKVSTHNGKVTIKNPATGKHRTFRIRTQPEDSRFAPGKRVVSLRVGGHSDADWKGWTGFAFVDADGQIKVWRKKQNGNWPVYARMLEYPETFESKGAEYQFEGHCRRCNRELTNPNSIESGIGPVCAKIIGG